MTRCVGGRVWPLHVGDEIWIGLHNELVAVSVPLAASLCSFLLRLVPRQCARTTCPACAIQDTRNYILFALVSRSVLTLQRILFFLLLTHRVYTLFSI
jgi:hypothetical protein